MQEEALHQRFEVLARERDFLAHKAENLQMEKEDMVRNHTIETGELRKKNTYLQEQLQKMQDTLERTPMAHGASSSGFSDDFNLDTDFDLNGDYWNDPMQMSNNDVSIKAEKIQSLHDSDKPAAAPGLLLIVCPYPLAWDIIHVLTISIYSFCYVVHSLPLQNLRSTLCLLCLNNCKLLPPTF